MCVVADFVVRHLPRMADTPPDNLNPTTDANRETKRLLFLALFVLGAVAVLHFTPLKQWIDDVQSWKVYVRQFGWWAHWGFIILSVGAIAVAHDAGVGQQALHVARPEARDLVEVEALERGARGYIPPGATLDVAIGATRLVFAGGTFIPASSFPPLAGKQRSMRCTPPIAEQFTHRQFVVLKCLREGKANRTIATELGMSEGTVKAHVRNIMQKLNATNRTQVVFLTREIFEDASD